MCIVNNNGNDRLRDLGRDDNLFLRIEIIVSLIYKNKNLKN